MPRAVSRILFLLMVAALAVAPAGAQDDARMKQLRLLCAQLSGDLTDPGGIAAFRRCLTTHDPLGEIERDNSIGHGVAAPPDRPNAIPPKGFGRDSRRALADGVRRFETLDGKLFYAVDKDGNVWRWDAETKKTALVDRHAATIRMVDAGRLLILDNAGALWREAGDGTGRAAVEHDVAEFEPAGPDLVYVQGRDGRLWRERSNADRVLVDSQVKAFQALEASIVYVLGNDGKLWRELSDARNRALVARQVTAFQFVPGGDTVYVLAADASLWRQEGKAPAEQVDRSVAAFQAVDMHLAYILGQDGRLWRQLGNRDQAVLVDHALLVAAGNASFQAVDAQHVIVLGADYKLWAETMPPGR